eukprot:3576981-Rhodomonas_salina.3
MQCLAEELMVEALHHRLGGYGTLQVRELIPAEFLELWQETQPPRPEMPPGAVSVRLRVLDSGWLEDRDALPSKQLWPSPGHLAGALAISTDSER